VLDAELFGHEKGAFTGAGHVRKGVFEEAHTGTLFFDEIGELSLGIQAKLLRVLESGDVIRLGSSKPQHVDVRLVAATNRDLRKAVSDGTFRSDFYFRLLGMVFTIPPLRERREEIVPLAERFAARYAEALGRPPPTLSQAAKDLLLGHDYPGNVRELRRTVERAVALARTGVVGPDELRLEPGVQASGQMSGQASGQVSGRVSERPSVRAPASEGLLAEVKDLERERIEEALEKTLGNQTAAAKLLGLSRHQLVRRLEAFGILRPRKHGSTRGD
jgi:transcriptional regulator with GAF, ATPase, and Fis domain